MIHGFKDIVKTCHADSFTFQFAIQANDNFNWWSNDRENDWRLVSCVNVANCVSAARALSICADGVTVIRGS